MCSAAASEVSAARVTQRHPPVCQLSGARQRGGESTTERRRGGYGVKTKGKRKMKALRKRPPVRWRQVGEKARETASEGGRKKKGR